MEQNRLSLPGLIKECEHIAQELNIQSELKNMNRKNFKTFLNEKTKLYNEKILKQEIKSKDYKKIKSFLDENCEQKDYFKELNVEDVRTKFRLRTQKMGLTLNRGLTGITKP